MDAKKIIELLEETNQLSAFSVEVTTEKGTLKMSFTPNGKEKKEEQNLSFLDDLKL